MNIFLDVCVHACGWENRSCNGLSVEFVDEFEMTTFGLMAHTLNNLGQGFHMQIFMILLIFKWQPYIWKLYFFPQRWTRFPEFALEVTLAKRGCLHTQGKIVLKLREIFRFLRIAVDFRTILTLFTSSFPSTKEESIPHLPNICPSFVPSGWNGPLLFSPHTNIPGTGSYSFPGHLSILLKRPVELQ